MLSNSSKQNLSAIDSSALMAHSSWVGKAVFWPHTARRASGRNRGNSNLAGHRIWSGNRQGGRIDCRRPVLGHSFVRQTGIVIADVILFLQDILKYQKNLCPVRCCSHGRKKRFYRHTCRRPLGMRNSPHTHYQL